MNLELQFRPDTKLAKNSNTSQPWKVQPKTKLLKKHGCLKIRHPLVKTSICPLPAQSSIKMAFMKKIILISLLSLSLNAIAEDCSKVIESVDEHFQNYKNTFKHKISIGYDFNKAALQWYSSNDGNCRPQAMERIAINAATEILSVSSKVNPQRIRNLLNYIAQKDMIKVLNEQQFESLKNNNILGAYSCKKNLIWLSPKNKPYNQGAVLIHEISHWARSLAIQQYKNLKQLKSLPEHLQNKQSYYLFDETLSSIEAAYRQLSYRNLIINNNFKKDDLIYQNSFSDLNLFNPYGNFINFWDSKYFDLFYTFSDFYKMFVLDSENRKSAKEVFKLAQKVYAPLEPRTLAEDLYHSSKTTFAHYEDLSSPIDWILTLDIKEVEKLDREKDCSFNTQNNHGGEGVGLDDGDLQLSDSYLRTCLKPIKDM